MKSWAWIVGGLVIWAVAIHIVFVVAVPDPIFAGDSIGYLRPGLQAIFDKPIEPSALRTAGYPVFLWLTLALTRGFLGVLVIQHAMALLVGVGAAGIAFYGFKVRPVSAALIFFLASALPLPAIYAHYILTENLYTFLLICWTVSLLIGIRKPTVMRGLLSGLLLGAAILVRPSGRGLLLVLVFLPFLYKSRDRSWRNLTSGILGMALVLLPAALYNVRQHGFFGLDRLGGLSLFCTTAKYLNPLAIQDPLAKSLLAPLYAEDASRFADGGWVEPYERLERHYSARDLDRLCYTLGYQAIRNQPLHFMIDRLGFLGLGVFKDGETPLYYRIAETVHFVYLGIDHYQSIAAGIPEAWRLVRHDTQDTAPYFQRLRMHPTGRSSGNIPVVPRSDAAPLYHFDWVLRMWSPIMGLIIHMRPVPLLAVMGGFFLCRFKDKRRECAILFGIIASQWLISTMAAGHDARYLVPLFPLYFVLIGSALDQAASQVFPKIQRAIIRKRSLHAER